MDVVFLVFGAKAAPECGWPFHELLACQAANAATDYYVRHDPSCFPG